MEIEFEIVCTECNRVLDSSVRLDNNKETVTFDVEPCDCQTNEIDELQTKIDELESEIDELKKER